MIGLLFTAGEMKARAQEKTFRLSCTDLAKLDIPEAAATVGLLRTVNLAYNPHLKGGRSRIPTAGPCVSRKWGSYQLFV
jgi:hypothetical protein